MALQIFLELASWAMMFAAGICHGTPHPEDPDIKAGTVGVLLAGAIVLYVAAKIVEVMA